MAERTRKVKTLKSVRAQKEETRTRKRKLKDCIELILSAEVTDTRMKNLFKKYGIEEDELTYDLALMLVVFQKGLNGDLKSIEFIRDTIGEAPVDNKNISANIEGGSVNIIMDYGE